DNTPRCDEDRLELIELIVFLLPSDEKVGVEVSAVDLQVASPVDKKKVVVMEATIRDALRLDDAEGVECLPNEEIFAELARMGYENPSTKLTFYKAFFSSYSSMASAVICLSSGRKFNFSKKQVGDLSTHTTKYTSPALTQKVFANMRRVGKGFSGVETPLFEGMLVAQEVEEGDADENIEDVNAGDATERDVNAANDEVPTADEEPSIPSPTPPTPPPQPSQDILSTSQVQPTPPQSPQPQPQPLQDRINTSDDTVIDDVSNQGRMIADMNEDADVVLEEAKDVDANAKDGQDADVQDNADIQGRIVESQAEIYKIDLDHANKVLSMHEEESEPAELQEVVDIVTTVKIITEVVTAASTTITAADVPIPTATTAVAPILTAAPSRRTKRVVIRDPEESTSTTSTIIHSEAKSKDKGKGILVEEPKPLKKQAQIEQDEKYARELEAELNKNIDWDEVIDHVNKKAKEDPAVKRYQALKRKPQTEAQARKNMMIYLKSVAGFKMDYFKEMSYDDIRPIFEAKFDSNIITFTTTQLILLVERRYLLTRFTLDQMLNVVRLEVKEESEELDDSLVRVATTASSLEAEQDSGNNNKTQSKATPNESSFQGTNSGSGPRCQETIGDTIAQTRSENVSKFSNDLLLARVNTPRSDEDRLKLNELMELCTTLQSRVLDLEKIKTTQALEIDSLKRRVESSDDNEDLGEDASKQGRISAIDADEDITLVYDQDDEQMFDVDQDLEEQQELNDKEKDTLFMQLLEKRKKFYAAKRIEEKRSKPPTQAQQRKIMCTYPKTVEGKKLTDLKNKSFDSIQKKFDRDFKRVNAFVDFRTELVEESSKKAEAELVKIIPDEEAVAIDVIPLTVKPPSIVDWKIHKEEKKSYYKIIRADGSSKIYLVFSYMLKDFDRKDVETLKIDMVNKKLHADYFDEMTYQLLKLITKQLKNPKCLEASSW
nr:hypothetical protein [Tanacetum cinerariifolium]